MGLRQSVQLLRDHLLEEELGEHAVAMEDCLREVDIVLDPDLGFADFMEHLDKIHEVLEERANPEVLEAYGFGAVGKLAGGAAKKIRAGFKMVFGKLVKLQKRFAKKQTKRTRGKSKRRPSTPPPKPAAAAAKQRAKKSAGPASKKPLVKPGSKLPGKKTVAPRSRATPSSKRAVPGRPSKKTRSR